MNQETILQREIHAAISIGATRLFRNNVGFDRVAKIHYGLCKGSSDLIGFTTREITPEMVGKRFAIFTALEIKTEAGRPTIEQKQFIENVVNAGGIAGIARSVEEAKKIVDTSQKEE